MCCGLCDHFKKVLTPGIGGTANLCSLTDREVDPKDCDCTEFAPCFPRLVTEFEKKEVD